MPHPPSNHDRIDRIDREGTMNSAVIIDAVRTPGGKRNGKLKEWHPASLAAHVLEALA